MSRQPFGIEQDEIAGCGNRHTLTDLEDSARYVGRIDRQLDRAWKRNVPRRRDGVDFCRRVGPAVERRRQLRASRAGEAGGKDKSQRSSAHQRNSLEIKQERRSTGKSRRRHCLSSVRIGTLSKIISLSALVQIGCLAGL